MAPSSRTGGKRHKQDIESTNGDDGVIVVEEAISTPKKRSNGTIEKDVTKSTPSKPRQPKANVSTPTKGKTTADDAPIIRNADRSARRKSARRLIEQAAAENASDEDELGQEEGLAQRIWDEDAGEDVSLDAKDDGWESEAQDQQQSEAQTPSKRPRGRPKGWKKPRTPTPPPDLPPYEHYFFQNRPGGAKTSNNTLSSLSLISHEDYFTTMSSYRDPHEPEQDFLHSIHARSFDQWVFELSQGFNICVYGWGSKRELLFDFATHLSSASPATKIVVVNGYNASLSLRDVLGTLAKTILALSNTKLPTQPSEAATAILRALSTSPPASPTVLLVHTLDGPTLRRPAAQSLLARLAASPHVHLLASADNPHFPLMWDATLATRFNWLFHDATTFRPYDVEVAGGPHGGVVGEVNALLGRSGRKLQGREGVMYVLKSLTANARNLYALLIAELLSLEDGEGEEDIEQGDAGNAMDDEDDDDNDDDAMDYENALGRPAGGREEEDDFEAALEAPSGTSGSRSKKTNGGARRTASGGMRGTIEYHSLYTKAMAQLITTNEVNYRGLLKEFYDHEMIVSRKDALGTETLGVPFRREEMEVLLGELVGG